MASNREKRLGRGLEDFSHLFFSSTDDVEPAAPNITTVASTRRIPLGYPRAVFVTGFRRGCGKTFVTSSLARECSRADGTTSTWQLGPGVIVPRRGGDFDRPIPHPADRRAFVAFAQGWSRATTLLLEGPVSLIADADPYALSVDEFIVIALPGREGSAEGYATVKEIVTARPEASIQLLVNRAETQDQARDVFHMISDVALRHLGRPIRSYGGIASLSAVTPQLGTESEARTVLFSRMARGLTARGEPTEETASYYESVWARMQGSV